ncbi:hypothetical protein EGW08_001179 [Elysia chlorotica]|uniref:Uncharacterized protein n=1 Tax=Elysia chlorotica TaxID=188477 RepID=A0A433UB49_ELYCH|nr:hypothetical protein EGW08_001179 [Elysia chlorotica]
MENFCFKVIAMVAAIVCVVHVTPSHAQTNNQANKCIEDFSNALIKCVTDASLTSGNFLWFVTNGTSSRSEKPTNEANFKKEICGLEEQIPDSNLNFAASFQQHFPDSNANPNNTSNPHFAAILEEQIHISGFNSYHKFAASLQHHIIFNPDSDSNLTITIALTLMLQQQIGACTFQSVAGIINSTACVGTSAATNQQAADRGVHLPERGWDHQLHSVRGDLGRHQPAGRDSHAAQHHLRHVRLKVHAP